MKSTLTILLTLVILTTVDTYSQRRNYDVYHGGGNKVENSNGPGTRHTRNNAFRNLLRNASTNSTYQEIVQKQFEEKDSRKVDRKSTSDTLPNSESRKEVGINRKY